MSQKKINARQHKAIEALLSGASNQTAAEQSGVSKRTIERWLNDATFAHELHKRSEFALRRAAVRLTALLELANSVFYEAMTSPNRQSRVKLAAANSVYTHLPKLIETTEILRRLDELEQRVSNEA